MSDITKQDVEHIAKLARLEVSSEEVQGLMEYFHEILAHFEKLGEVDLSRVDPFGVDSAPPRPLREDILVEDSSREAILNQAPLRDGDYIKVPHIMEGE